MAMVALMLACIDPVEEFLRWGPCSLSIFKIYVDDFSLTFTFGGGVAATYVVEVVEEAYRKLDTVLRYTGLKLSIDKNKSVSNKVEVATQLKKRLADMKMKSDAEIVKLGVDYAAGCPVKYTKAKERISRAKDKRDAIMAYCKGGWRAFNVVRAHVVSAALYGASVHGAPSKQLFTCSHTDEDHYIE